jgi:hypothetical protein
MLRVVTNYLKRARGGTAEFMKKIKKVFAARRERAANR